jgi:hypothetical protein
MAVQINDAHVMDEWGLLFKLHVEWAKSDGKKRGRKGTRRQDSAEWQMPMEYSEHAYA